MCGSFQSTKSFDIYIPGWWWLEHEWIIFPYIGDHHPNWLSYFSEGFKPPTRYGLMMSWVVLLIVFKWSWPRSHSSMVLTRWSASRFRRLPPGGGVEYVLSFHILGMSSSQLTFLSFKGVFVQPPSQSICFSGWMQVNIPSTSAEIRCFSFRSHRGHGGGLFNAPHGGFLTAKPSQGVSVWALLWFRYPLVI